MIETFGQGQRPQLPPRAAREPRAKARGAAKKSIGGAGIVVVLLLTLALVLPYLTDRRRDGRGALFTKGTNPMYAFAFIIAAAWIFIPNAVLALVTLNRADTDTHLAASALAFIPWTLFGLSLI